MINLYGDSIERIVRRETRDAIMQNEDSSSPIISSLLLEIATMILVQRERTNNEASKSAEVFNRAYSAALDEALTIAVSSQHEKYRERAEYVASVLNGAHDQTH